MGIWSRLDGYVTGGALEIATCGGWTIGFGFQLSSGMALISHGLSLTTQHAQDMRFFNQTTRGHYFQDFGTHWRKKSGSIDPTLPADPDELLKNPDWKETTHPDARKNGHRKFENKKTGEKLRHDEAKSGFSGHKGHDHYHRPNPNSTSWKDEFLDGQGNPVPDKHDKAHIYSPDTVWWN